MKNEENYANKDVNLYYKKRNLTIFFKNAEVDFIWQLKEKVIPFEVKSGENLGSRSLVVYREKYNPAISVKTSMKNVEIQEGLINIPLYLLWNLEEYIQKMIAKDS